MNISKISKCIVCYAKKPKETCNNHACLINKLHSSYKLRKQVADIKKIVVENIKECRCHQESHPVINKIPKAK